ncbi:metal-dependent hydrolase family protein [Ferrimonas balearica]|uniref:metal-dependent hydrolase family protein n=1 Tax=Ferrimonas balearica TaxID=44012 RepID=UPI001C99B686|nr:amidohydrolase family protein [Ferrimonas balearica]MBY5920733.1 amidohydrolase family protein [Ferrimonas balearica]MBY5996582.1 amidohydrolase family protein [Ferrimonas balearica]
MRVHSFWLLATLLSSPAQSGETLIHAGQLIDGISDQPRQQVTVVVEGNRILEVLSGYRSPSDEQQLIDLSDHTLMPGLMDMHTHVDMVLSGDSYGEAFFIDPADRALRATDYTEATLMAGFTTVRNLGGTVALSLRDAINAGHILGPRIYAAGTAIATTGGHGDPTNGLNQELSSLKGKPGPAEGVISGPHQARDAIRQRYKDGADVIKLTVTGGVLSLAKSGDNPQFMADEMEAIMAAARDYNYVVAVHAHGAEGMKRAVMAGVDSVEHGTYMNDEVIRLMKKNGTWYVPTISAGRYVAEHAEQYPAIVRPKAKAVGPQIQATFAKAYAEGVRIAFGTDAGVFPHGENGQEFIYMVEAGMPPMAAIQSATINAATLLRIDDQLGSVEPGKLADLVAVKGDPLTAIQLMTDVRFVMKDGQVVKAD